MDESGDASAMSFNDRVAEHGWLATWRGALNCPTFVGFARSLHCGDEIWLDLEVVQNSIRQARFHGQGCVVSQACASMLCEGIEGRSVDEIVELMAEQLMNFDFRVLSIDQQCCALTPWEALCQAIPRAATNGAGRVCGREYEGLR